MRSISLVIPAYNEEAGIRQAVEEAEQALGKLAANYEIIVVDNNSSEPSAREYLASLKHPVLPFAEPFNYSRINNVAARTAAGDFLLFLNNDTEVISPEWLTAMLELAQQLHKMERAEQDSATRAEHRAKALQLAREALDGSMPDARRNEVHRLIEELRK